MIMRISINTRFRNLWEGTACDAPTTSYSCPYHTIFLPLLHQIHVPTTSYLGPYFSVRRERGERWRAAARRRSGVMARMASTVSASGMARPW